MVACLELGACELGCPLFLGACTFYLHSVLKGTCGEDTPSLSQSKHGDSLIWLHLASSGSNHLSLTLTPPTVTRLFRFHPSPSVPFSQSRHPIPTTSLPSNTELRHSPQAPVVLPSLQPSLNPWILRQHISLPR